MKEVLTIISLLLLTSCLSGSDKGSTKSQSKGETKEQATPKPSTKLSQAQIDSLVSLIDKTTGNRYNNYASELKTIVRSGDMATRASYSTNNTALMVAIQGDLNEPAQLLIEYGADVNEQDSEGDTALSSATYRGNKAMRELLLKSGARSTLGVPLLDHIFEGNTQGALEELHKGVDPNISDSDPFYPTHALYLTALLSNHEVARALLDKGATLEPSNAHFALDRAIEMGDTTMMRLLIDAGANLEFRDQFNNTPLMNALIYEQVEPLRLLIASGADPNAINDQDGEGHYGQTPLNIAVKYSSLDVVKTLVKAGADIGYSELGSARLAEDIAEAEGKDDIYNYLKPLTDLERVYTDSFIGNRYATKRLVMQLKDSLIAANNFTGYVGEIEIEIFSSSDLYSEITGTFKGHYNAPNSGQRTLKIYPSEQNRELTITMNDSLGWQIHYDGVQILTNETYNGESETRALLDSIPLPLFENSFLVLIGNYTYTESDSAMDIIVRNTVESFVRGDIGYMESYNFDESHILLGYYIGDWMEDYVWEDGRIVEYHSVIGVEGDGGGGSTIKLLDLDGWITD